LNIRNCHKLKPLPASFDNLSVDVLKGKSNII
jgi:hypothetical protein